MKIKRNDLSSVFEWAYERDSDEIYVSPGMKKILDKVKKKKSKKNKK